MIRQGPFIFLCRKLRIRICAEPEGTFLSPVSYDKLCSPECLNLFPTSLSCGFTLTACAYYRTQNTTKAIGKPIKKKLLFCVKIDWIFSFPHIFLTFENIKQKNKFCQYLFLHFNKSYSSVLINRYKLKIHYASPLTSIPDSLIIYT